MAHQIDQSLKAKDYLHIFLKGICMGIAEIIPGISGGTIAFLLGIYERFINSLKSFNMHFMNLLIRFKFREALSAVAWRFLFALFLGMVVAIILLSHLLSWLIEHHPVLIFSFFFGLILATGPIIARIVERWTLFKVVTLVAVGIITYFFVALVPINTPESKIFLFLCGAIAICAMMLPGISGSFVLLLMGKYHYILEAVNQRDFLTIIVFIMGITVGILSFVRVISWLFHRFHDMTLCVLTGFVLGSLNKIWPWKKTIRFMEGRHGEAIPVEQINQWPGSFDVYVQIAFFAMLLGFMLALSINSSHKDTFKQINKP